MGLPKKIRAYLQAPNGEEVRLEVGVPEPIDATKCIYISEEARDLVSREPDCWIRIIG